MPGHSVAACVLHAGLAVCAAGSERRSRCSSRSLHRSPAAGSPIIATRSLASCGSTASATVAPRSRTQLPVRRVPVQVGQSPVGWHEIAGDMPDRTPTWLVIVCGEGDQAQGGASPVPLFRRGRRRAALQPRGGTSAHRPAALKPANPVDRAGAWRHAAQPQPAEGRIDRSRQAVPGRSARGAGQAARASKPPSAPPAAKSAISGSVSRPRHR